METDPGPPDPAPQPVAVLEELLVSRGERLLHAAAYNNTPSPGEVIQYTWLSPTSGNQAYLGIPTPADFTRTRSPASAP